MRKLVVLFGLMLLLTTGCGHNTSMFFSGWYVKGGIDPQTYVPTVAIADGVQVTDISRENSQWTIEVDQNIGLSISKDGVIKGVKSIKRSIGPQVTGYFVDLAKASPELAKVYAEAEKAYWESQIKGTK